jgi:hypothetical protein
MVFKPGQSGNPRGRMSRTKRTAEIYSALCVEFGGEHELSAAEVELLRLCARLIMQAGSCAQPARAARLSREARALLTMVHARRRESVGKPPADDALESYLTSLREKERISELPKVNAGASA